MALVICLLLIPSWRQAFNIFWLRLLQGSPDLTEQAIEIPEETYNWEVLHLEKAEWQPFSITKNKVVFLNFWATWCGPCVAEMKSIQQLYDSYGDEVIFLLISTEKPQKIMDFKKQRDYSLPFYTIVSLPEIFQTNTFPTTFIINKKGDIIVKEFGSHNWNSEGVRNLLDKLLNE